jgi:hypothetical protein
VQLPEATLPILDALYRDRSEYVRRSVANHLNDLARHAPDVVVAAAARWLAAPDDNTAWVVRHGLRTLVKKGHPGALALQGFQSAKVFKLTALTLAAGETRTLVKRHAFRPMTTRVHHPGMHALELQVNGLRQGRTDFRVDAG